MASFITLASGASMPLPPGYKFKPTDEEIVVRYLRCRSVNQPLPSDIIQDKDVLNHYPWDLVPEGASEKYFFNHRVRKWGTGTRWNRATKDGFWKASGNEIPLFCTGVRSRVPVMVGLKRKHVFYLGKLPSGQHTAWVMQEYRLTGAGLRPYRAVRPCTNNNSGQSSNNIVVVGKKQDNPADAIQGTPLEVKNNGILVKPDESWVVCRIYKKRTRKPPVTIAVSNNTPPITVSSATPPITISSSSSTSGAEKVCFFDFLGQGK